MIRNILMLSAVLLVSMAGMELVLRMLQVEGAERLPAFQADAQTGWSRPPNQNGFIVQRVPGIFKTHFQTNSRGMRDREYAVEKSGKLRILALGDSVTEGWGVEETETYPKVLESHYLQGVEVWNLGVIGYGTDQELRRLGQVIDTYHPDIVTLAFFFNDLSDNSFSRALWSPNYVKPHFDVQGEALVLTDAAELHRQELDSIHDAQSWGGKARASLEGLSFFRLTRYVAKTVHGAANRTTGNGAEKRDTPWWGLANLYRTTENGDLTKAWTLSERLLAEINRLCASHGVKFVLTYVPGPMDGIPGMMETELKHMRIDEPAGNFDVNRIEGRLQLAAEHSRIPFVPMADRFRSTADPAGLFLPQVPKDAHIGVRGHQLVAHGLAEYLHKEGIIPVQHLRAGNFP
jgi:lysophospholipase L1-like esterase